MSILRWLMEDKNQQPTPKFITKIDIHPKSTLYVEVQPKDPTNCSNIVITAFASKQVRTIIPIRVQWSRFKIRSDAVHTDQKIHCLVGNTYMCEPGDVGAYIKAVVKSVDDPKAEAEVTIGPIGIDVMMKRLIQGALYSGTLLSQVVCVQKERKNNVTVRLNSTDIEFVDDNSGQKLVKDYSMSEPKIELNPKDATRVYLRFEQDPADEVRQWLNLIFHVRNNSLNQSSMSEKVPYRSHSESSSKLKLFQKPQRTHCINKLEIRFISRNSRDLFLFTQRAFICRQDMKNTVYIQRIETLQNIATEEDYYRFLNYMTLKNQIIRLADFAKDLQDDRDSKVKDLIAMEESIGEMTLTYLKIIEEKGKNQHIDFEQSYSQINLTRQEMLNRKNVRQLKKQNESLKQRLRQMNQQMQLLKFFKKEQNQSMIFNQTSNPFAKKGAQHSVSYQIGMSPDDHKDKRKNMFDMSMNYTKLLQQNNHLKKQLMSNKKKTVNNMLDKSKGMMELLGDLEKQEVQTKYEQYENKIAALTSENIQLKKKIDELIVKPVNMSANQSMSEMYTIKSFSVLNQSVAALNKSGASSVADFSMNQSMTSEAALCKLQQNLRSLSQINEKLQEDNTRLRRQRDYYRTQASKLNNKLNTTQKQMENSKVQQSHFVSMTDNSVVYRFREENEALQNEKKALLKKLQSLSKQNASGIRQEFIQKQKKLKQYEELVNRLKLQNIQMSNQLQETHAKTQQQQFFLQQNIKLKKINSELLQQIKSLKIELSLKNDNLYNSRVIQMQNELDVMKSNNELSNDNKKLLDQINELTKTNTRLKTQCQDYRIKLEHQTTTIEKLMRQNAKGETPNKKPGSSSSSTTKQKAYSQKCNQATVEQVQKYKREIKKLQEQIIFIKKSSDAINRSRDLTLEMDGYYEQKIEVMKKQLEAVYHENENLSKMCERYGKDAREANKQLNKWKEKAMELMRAKTEESILLSNG